MNGNTMEKIRKEELKISGRKDWIIFWFFAVMISYVAGGLIDRPINGWLKGMTGPWLTDLNMPSNYGRTIGAVILLAVLTEVLMFLRKKNVKAKIGVAVAGAVLVFAIVGIHQVHCRLIVSVLYNEEPKSMTLNDNVFQGQRAHRMAGGPERRLSPFFEACFEWFDVAQIEKLFLTKKVIFGIFKYDLQVVLPDNKRMIWGASNVRNTVYFKIDHPEF